MSINHSTLNTCLNGLSPALVARSENKDTGKKNIVVLWIETRVLSHWRLNEISQLNSVLFYISRKSKQIVVECRAILHGFAQTFTYPMLDTYWI
jgi:hypothetical protein